MQDLFIGEINLEGTNGLVIRPKHLIGVTDGVKIRTIWNFGLHNLFSGRIRQVILYGKGRIIINEVDLDSHLQNPVARSFRNRLVTF